MDKEKLEMLDIESTNDISKDIHYIINQSQKIIFTTIDIVLLQRNWLIGKRIYEEELKESRKENYGKQIITELSEDLTKEYGKGFNYSNLYRYYKFYTLYKNIFATPRPNSFLSWTHYKLLITIHDKKARDWYEKEALECAWSVRTLQRNIYSQYYYRLLASANKEAVVKEMEEKTKEYQLEKYEHIKSPLIFEAIGIKESSELIESELESAIINNIQKVLIELGKGYSFVGRQYRIKTEENNYFVDLVFYNFILKCFVLIDLKTSKITHQDVGQMDMYVRMFDELIKSGDDNPTLGIVLCSETDKDIARYSILRGNEQLFASKYKLYLPSEEELKEEIEKQKELFYLKMK